MLRFSDRATVRVRAKGCTHHRNQPKGCSDCDNQMVRVTVRVRISVSVRISDRADVSVKACTHHRHQPKRCCDCDKQMVRARVRFRVKAAR